MTGWPQRASLSCVSGARDCSFSRRIPGELPPIRPRFLWLVIYTPPRGRAHLSPAVAALGPEAPAKARLNTPLHRNQAAPLA